MATTPITPRQQAPLQPLSALPAKQPRSAGMYVTPDVGRSLLPRGLDQGRLLPSDENRIVPSWGPERGILLPADEGRLVHSRDTDHGMILPSDGSQPLMPRGAQLGALLPSDQGRQNRLRGNDPGMFLASNEGRQSLPWGSEGGIFLASDDYALTRQIQQLHHPDARTVNVRPLFQLVEEIIDRASPVEGHSPGALLERDAMEGRRTLHGLEEVPDLPLIIERISCEITCKILSGTDAHSTTLSVLRNLSLFSWEAKVVLTLAAFALTFGDFWLLVQIYSTNPLAKSMAIIKRLPTVVEHVGAFKTQFEATNSLIRAMLETTRCIIEFGELPATYLSDEEVKAAMTHFPIAVYWIVRSSVTAATQITTFSSKGFNQQVTAIAEARELSNWAHKLNTITEHLRNTLSNLYRLIAEKRDIDAYNLIVQIIYHQIHIDNMKVLKILIYPDDDVAPLYDGLNKRRVHLELLRSRHVLLLISGLEISHEELYNLQESYRESKTHSYEIVWIPVVDRSVQWTEAMKAQLESLQNSMPWYSVHHPSIIGNAAIKFFRNDWHFKGRPILVVLGPQGQVLNENALHMMWIWQNQAFDFTNAREQQLWSLERWTLELLVDNIDPKIQEWIREDKYIFLYGGDDLGWIRKFSSQARSVARALQIPLEMVYVGRSHNRDLVRRVCATINVEQLSHCWQETNWVWYFWTRIESMIHSKIKMNKIDDHGDIILQEIQRLHSHDKAHDDGWALLAKGPVILVHGPGKIVLTALEQFDDWRKDGMVPGYPNHFMKIYTSQFPCHRLHFPDNMKVPHTMFCSDCRRNMQRYHSFICCHEDDMAEAGVPPAVVEYEP